MSQSQFTVMNVESVAFYFRRTIRSPSYYFVSQMRTSSFFNADHPIPKPVPSNSANSSQIKLLSLDIEILSNFTEIKQFSLSKKNNFWYQN
jgi:hypothetical protein